MISDKRVKLACAILIFLGLFSLVMAWTAEAQTNPNCSPRATALNAAKKMHQEVPIFFGPASAGNSIIVTLSAKGSWSLFLCTGDRCCIVAGGQTAQFLRGA